MKVVGIIAEYNPFHKGHAYQIEELRKKTGADYVIIAMSGNFLQRGTPALCDKYTRARMALSCGADLVLEIPTLWATGSAEYFANGGVALLANTGVVTHLGFGAESKNMEELQQVSSILKEEPATYRNVLANSIRTGNPFPVARKNALVTSIPSLSAEKLSEILDSPNNILALEYLKALPKNIDPVLIPRKGAGYHNTDITEKLPSASAIRGALLAETGADMDLIKASMPEAAFGYLEAFLENYNCIETNDFSSMLGYRLLSLADSDLSHYADCSQDLSNKIRNHLPDYSTMEDFIQILKSKDITYTRISRCLLHILLEITQSNYYTVKALGYTPYLRVLGFREKSSALLSSIKKNAKVPIITKVADAKEMLGYENSKMLDNDIFASTLYYQTLASKAKKKSKPLNEYTSQIVII